MKNLWAKAALNRGLKTGGGWVGTGKATGKQKAKYRNERVFRLNFKRSIIRRYKHSVLH